MNHNPKLYDILSSSTHPHKVTWIQKNLAVAVASSSNITLKSLKRGRSLRSLLGDRMLCVWWHPRLIDHATMTRYSLSNMPFLTGFQLLNPNKSKQHNKEKAENERLGTCQTILMFQGGWFLNYRFVQTRRTGASQKVGPKRRERSVGVNYTIVFFSLTVSLTILSPPH